MENLSGLTGIFDIEVSLFPGHFKVESRDVSHPKLKDVLLRIQSDEFSDKISIIRSQYLALQKAKSEDEKKKLKSDITDKKNNLPALIFAAHCNHRKAQDKCTAEEWENRQNHLTGLLACDFDVFTKELTRDIAKNQLSKDKYILFCFKSPTKGLKAGLRITATNEAEYKECFRNAIEYFKINYNLVVEKSDYSMKCCCISYDKDLFVNPNAELFEESFPHEVKDDVSSTIETFPLHNIDDNSIQGNEELRKFAFNYLVNKNCKILKEMTDGTKHKTRIEIGTTLGTYANIGYINPQGILDKIDDTIRQTTTDYNKAVKDLQDGIIFGLTQKLKYNLILKKFLSQQKFWIESIQQKKEPELLIDEWKLYHEFLHNRGYRILEYENSTKKRLVRIENQIIYESTADCIRGEVSKFVASYSKDISLHFTKKDLEALILKRTRDLFSPEKIMQGLKHEKQVMQADTPNESFFYFKNGFCVVSQEGIKFKSYNELENFIWYSQIIQHDFSIDNDLDDFDFSRFLINTCTDPETKESDENRFFSLFCTIGYLLHTYNNPAYKKCIIFTESTAGETAEGRSGKSLIGFNAIEKLRPTTFISGKEIRKNDGFMYQNCTEQTKVVVLDDLNKNFDFESLYSAITGKLTVNKKHTQAFDIEAKFVITTNFGIGGSNGSSMARRFDMELLPYYSKKNEPEQEFGRRFFDTWTAGEWNKFYNLMLTCSQMYFENNCKIPAYNSDTITVKKLLSVAGAEIIEFALNLPKNQWIESAKLYQEFLSQNGLKENNPIAKNSIEFSKKLNLVLQENNVKFENKAKWLNVTIKNSYGEETIQGKTVKAYFIYDGNQNCEEENERIF